MNISINLLESDSEIRRAILQQIREVMQGAIRKSLPAITDQVKNSVREALRREPEYNSLVSGKLKAEFGMPSSADVDIVVNALVETINVQNNPLKITNLGISGGITITMMKSDDLDGVINIASAYVSDYNRGYSLPWLEWLLLRSNQTIVKNYEVKMGNNLYSRSGMALMVKSNRNWRVPPEYAGSQSNNWTTRAVSTTEDEITKIIRTNIEASIP